MSLPNDISIALSPELDSAKARNPELALLLESCMANDRSAQETLYKKYYGKMMALCMRYVKNRDDALEILNLGFLKVFKSLDRYNYSGPFEAWIYRIVYNSLIDHVRAKTRELQSENFDLHAYEIETPNHSLQQLYADDLMKLLDHLPETSRIVFNMFAIEGYKHEEIADKLGLSAGTSKWHVNQARNILKSILEKQF